MDCVALVLGALLLAVCCNRADGLGTGLRRTARNDASLVLLRGNGQGKNGGGGEEPNKWLEETNSKLPMDPSGVMPSVAAQEARALDGDQTNETADVNDTLADGQDDGGATGTSDEGADGDAHHEMSTTEELEARLKDVDTMKQFVHGHMNKMNDLIKSEMERMEAERRRNAELKKDNDRKELEKKMERTVNVGQITKRFRKRRKEINKCLLMIHGGADRLYWDLRKKFMTIPSGQVCIVFKKIAFPHLPVVGFTEALYRQYIHWSPPSDGSMLQYFDAVKTKMFRCMCEEADTKMSLKDMQAASHARAPAVDNIDQLSKKYSQKIKREIDEDAKNLLDGKPLKHTIHHDWGVDA